MTVDDVVFDILFVGEGFDALHKFRDVIRQLRFRDGAFGSSRHVDNAVTVSQFMHNMRDVVVL